MESAESSTQIRMRRPFELYGAALHGRHREDENRPADKRRIVQFGQHKDTANSLSDLSNFTYS